ncbi:MAG: hypothetical protein AMS22_02535 [Thiotrichales bacterium SG8_50]|nr:MAG: hypothetical protein AMS22_02535 [Thiotrichales bacterium SG8_50]
MTSSRPYLLRALHEWITDNGMTPHLLVNAELPDVVVPQQYVDKGKIVLNVSTSAVHALELGNDLVSFSARFAGSPMSVSFPIGAVMAIYARENGQGMMFPEEESQAAGDADASGESKPSKPHLTLIK